MILTLDNAKSIINKFIECYEYIEPDYGQTFYTNDIPSVEECKIVYKQIYDVKIFSCKLTTFVTIYFINGDDLDLHVGDEIHIFKNITNQ